MRVRNQLLASVLWVAMFKKWQIKIAIWVFVLLPLQGNANEARLTPTSEIRVIGPLQTVNESNRTFSWNHVEGVSHYRVWAKDYVTNEIAILETFLSSEVCVDEICEIESENTFTADNRTDHQWMIKAWNADGWTAWSSRYNFRIQEDEALVHPAAASVDAFLTYTALNDGASEENTVSTEYSLFQAEVEAASVTDLDAGFEVDKSATDYPVVASDVPFTYVSVANSTDVGAASNVASAVFLDTYFYEVLDSEFVFQGITELFGEANSIKGDLRKAWNLNFSLGVHPAFPIHQTTGGQWVGNVTTGGVNFDIYMSVKGSTEEEDREICFDYNIYDQNDGVKPSCVISVGLVTTNPRLFSNGLSLRFDQVANWLVSDDFKNIFLNPEGNNGGVTRNTPEKIKRVLVNNRRIVKGWIDRVSNGRALLFPSANHVVGELHLGNRTGVDAGVDAGVVDAISYHLNNLAAPAANILNMPAGILPACVSPNPDPNPDGYGYEDGEACVALLDFIDPLNQLDLGTHYAGPYPVMVNQRLNGKATGMVYFIEAEDKGVSMTGTLSNQCQLQLTSMGVPTIEGEWHSFMNGRENNDTRGCRALIAIVQGYDTGSNPNSETFSSIVNELQNESPTKLEYYSEYQEMSALIAMTVSAQCESQLAGDGVATVESALSSYQNEGRTASRSCTEVNSISRDEVVARGVVYLVVNSQTGDQEYRWIDSGNTHVGIDERCALSLGGPTAAGDWNAFSALAFNGYGAANPCG